MTFSKSGFASSGRARREHWHKCYFRRALLLIESGDRIADKGSDKGTCQRIRSVMPYSTGPVWSGFSVTEIIASCKGDCLSHCRTHIHSISRLGTLFNNLMPARLFISIQIKGPSFVIVNIGR
jgi:hypothetical protein